MKLFDYNIAVIASENVVVFLDILLQSLRCLKFPMNQFYLGDGGLFEPSFYAKIYEVNVVDLLIKRYTNFKTQSNEYRDIINNRVYFLNKVCELCSGKPMLQLDVDTYIVKSEFAFVDPLADVVLTVRKTRQCIKEHAEFADSYPNLGVVFWNKPERCFQFWKEWGLMKYKVKPSGGQYEQNHFLHTMKTGAMDGLNMQTVLCQYANCYKVKWFNEFTTIVHFKGCEGRDETGRLPNKDLLTLARGK